MDEFIGALEYVRVLSKLDANSGYWKIEVNKEVRDKMVFTSHHILFPFRPMSVGLENAPETLQRVMKMMGTTVKRQFALSTSTTFSSFLNPL